MIKEFAVDPTFYSTRSEWLLIFQHFGFHKGRLISKFPKDWKKLAYKNLMDNYRRKRIKEVERISLEEKLKNLEQHFFDLNRTYDNNSNWYDNSIKEDNRLPFHAIISRVNPNNIPKVLRPEQLDEENDYWNINCQVYSQRSASDITNNLSPILEQASEIYFVDPHFDPTEQRYRNTLNKFLKCVSRNNKVKKVEYHLLEDPRVNQTSFANSCKQYIKPMLQNNLHIKMVRWQKYGPQDPNAGGRRMHARFILTEKGGLLMEWGLDEGVQGDEVNIFILEPHIYLKQLSLIDKKKSNYNYIDEIII